MATKRQPTSSPTKRPAKKPEAPPAPSRKRTVAKKTAVKKAGPKAAPAKKAPATRASAAKASTPNKTTKAPAKKATTKKAPAKKTSGRTPAKRAASPDTEPRSELETKLVGAVRHTRPKPAMVSEILDDELDGEDLEEDRESATPDEEVLSTQAGLKRAEIGSRSEHLPPGDEDDEDDTDAPTIDELIHTPDEDDEDEDEGGDDTDPKGAKAPPSPPDEDDDDLDEEEDDFELRPRSDNEFQCLSCFLVKARVQLADPVNLLCRDCD